MMFGTTQPIWAVVLVEFAFAYTLEALVGSPLSFKFASKILKGQIEYDFELPHIEKAAEEFDIPVFRLETDYQYQDMEQLRIRMEAFGEMLNQRNIVKRKAKRSA